MTKKIEINGLLWDTENLIIDGNEHFTHWDTENLIIDGNEHFTHNEALETSKKSGKRLPTKEEWKALIALGSTWDSKRTGRWFGNDHKLKEKSKQSIFLPAAGYRANNSSSYGGVGTNGYYWSSSINGTSAYYSYFYSTNVLPGNTNGGRANGFSVRCVSEL